MSIDLDCGLIIVQARSAESLMSGLYAMAIAPSSQTDSALLQQPGVDYRLSTRFGLITYHRHFLKNL